MARRELLDELIGELADRGTTVFVATNDIAGIEPVAELEPAVATTGDLVNYRLRIDRDPEVASRVIEPEGVVGGLAISTLLTLFVVPVFYVYVEQAGEAVRRLYSLARGRRPGTVVP